VRAPKRTFDIPALGAAFEVLVLGGAGVGLALIGHPWLGLAFGVVALLNRIVLIALDRKQAAT
jgi:uncharacterized protein DUF2568